MVEVLKLSNPIMIDGKKIKELTYDFDCITPAHYVAAEVGKFNALKMNKKNKTHKNKNRNKLKIKYNHNIGFKCFLYDWQ